MQLGLDLDDTVIDHMPHRLRLARRCGFELSLEEIQRGCIRDLLGAAEYSEFQRTLYGKLSLNAPPINGAIDALTTLLKVGPPFIIISRRKPEHQIFAREWLKRHIPALDENRIRFVESDAVKGELCSAINIGLFLDDSPEVLNHLPAETLAVLFDPLGVYENAQFHIVRNWGEFLELVRGQWSK